MLQAVLGLLDGPWHAQAADYCGLSCINDDDCGPWDRCVPLGGNASAAMACHFCPWEEEASCTIVHCQPPAFMSQYTVLINMAAIAALVHHTIYSHGPEQGQSHP